MTITRDATLAALAQALRENPGDDATRLVYADALEDDDRVDEAAAQRVIARMGLRLYTELGGTDRSNIREAFASHYDVPETAEDPTDGVVVNENFDEELLVATFSVADDQISEGPFVISGARGDLTMKELCRLIERAIQ